MTLARLRREQSQGEEIANSISHGIGLVAALVGTPFLITQAARHGNVGFVVGASLFSATVIFLYLASTLYHALPVGKTKRVFRVLEHPAINQSKPGGGTLAINGFMAITTSHPMNR